MLFKLFNQIVVMFFLCYAVLICCSGAESVYMFISEKRKFSFIFIERRFKVSVTERQYLGHVGFCTGQI